MLNLQEILNLKMPVFTAENTKLVRHKDNRREYRDIIKNRDDLLKYQKHQTKEVFKNLKYIISFIGIENSKGLLFGIFEVKGVNFNGKEYVYDLEELTELQELNDRLVIDWGKSTVSWHQYYNNTKEILEILPKGYIGNFPGLTNFVLDYNELKKLMSNPDANRDWYYNLSSVNGIYMILDKQSGKQYIGSANGKKGIWQRWSEYAKTLHGENNLLKDLLEKESEGYEQNFQYTVLQTLPSNITQKEIIKLENLYKIKFGTKSFGLNKN